MNPDTSPDTLLDNSETCERYGISKSTEWRLRQQGKLPKGFKIGNKRLRSLKELKECESNKEA